jgi:hypothetical protein
MILLSEAMEKYTTILDETGNALMIYRGNALIFSSSANGIRPHLEAIKLLGKDGLKGTVMVDKIVGRAAALLMIYSSPSEVYAGVITGAAKDLLEVNGIHVYSGEIVEAVKQKDGRIYCPFEAMVQGISDAEEAYVAIIEKMSSMN